MNPIFFYHEASTATAIGLKIVLNVIQLGMIISFR